MEAFIHQHAEKITGVLNGFDRVLFKGVLFGLSSVKQLEIWLSSQRVLHKDFKPFAQSLSERIRNFAEKAAAAAQRPYLYLPSSRESKEELVRSIIARDKIDSGLVCVLGCVEPCQTFSVRGDRKTKHLVLAPQERRCQHFYFYLLDKKFGLMHIRLQSWIPFNIQVCINGREYLARRMEKMKIAFEKRDNCFTWIADLDKAQKLIGELETKKWAPALHALARRYCPVLDDEKLNIHDYYWTVREGEYATDVMFKSSDALRQIYPALVQHAMKHFSAPNVLRFLGRRVQAKRFDGEVTTDVVERTEGVRIKHRVEENSIKMYDKQGNVLRIETTINNPKRFRVWRCVTRQNRRVSAWVPMRKGIVDIARRVQVSLAANQRYLDALAVVHTPRLASQTLDPVCKPLVVKNKRFRPIRPISPEDADLFKHLLAGHFKLEGFRNSDLRAHLYPDSSRDPELRRRSSSRVSHLLRLLAAHKLIRKLPHTNCYRVTNRGNSIMNTALTIRAADVSKLAA